MDDFSRTQRTTFSTDVETENLHGKLAFAIGAVVRRDGQTIAEFQGRAPTPKSASGWVKQNVLPSLVDMKQTHQSVRALEEDFWKFWEAHRTNVDCVAYFANQGGEAALFNRMINREYEKRWKLAPSPLHDVCTLMLARGFHDLNRIDLYMRRYNLQPQCVPRMFHHPLFDAHAAALVWEHLSKQK